MKPLHLVYLGLGTNLGDRLENLRSAVQALAPKLTNLQTSSIYETEPWGFTDQPSFYNMVVSGETKFSPDDLLTFLKNLEEELGRLPSFRYGPRLIDVDILFYNDLIMKSEKLEIPHPRLVERAFVLVPLVELKPDLIHPVEIQTCQELLARLDTKSVKFVQRFPSLFV